MTLNKLYEICVELWETGIWQEKWIQLVFIPFTYPINTTCYEAATLLAAAHTIQNIYNPNLKERLCKNKLDLGQDEACDYKSQIYR